MHLNKNSLKSSTDPYGKNIFIYLILWNQKQENHWDGRKVKENNMEEFMDNRIAIRVPTRSLKLIWKGSQLLNCLFLKPCMHDSEIQMVSI